MMKTVSAVAATLTFSLLNTPLQAQQQMRSGLWEHSFTMQSQSGEMEKGMREMQQQLSNMPPEQRKMMEQMMASQGMQLGPNGQTVRVCISEEQAAQGMPPQSDSNCRQEVIERKGDTIKFRFHCPGNPPSSGQGEVTFSSPTRYNGKSTISTMVNGQSETVTTVQSGKWLSYECGDLQSK